MKCGACPATGQGLAVNQMAAAITAHYCVQGTIEREVRQLATTFNLGPPTI